MLNVNRPLIAQEFNTFAVTVGVAPAQPLGPQYPITALIDTFFITVPTTAANSVFIGGQPTVTTANGLELLAGTTTAFIIVHDGRQLYELQEPAIDISRTMCNKENANAIPYVVWDLQNLVWVVAAAATLISVAPFKAMYI